MNKEEMLKKLKVSVKSSAENARMNAGYAGSWSDGGAHDMEKKLEAFLDGYEFALTGKTKVYAKFFEELEKEQDPDYQKYLELKGKFGEYLMTWVDNLDKSVETLLLHIEKLKVKANDQIPSVMKLNPISKGVITQKSVQYLFKVGSSYYERDPNTLEEVDSKLHSIKLQAEQDKQKINAEAESNAAAIENNKKIVTKITQIMKDLGIPNNWSRSYYKTVNSRKMTTETNQAGYIGDLS